MLKQEQYVEFLQGGSLVYDSQDVHTRGEDQGAQIMRIIMYSMYGFVSQQVTQKTMVYCNTVHEHCQFMRSARFRQRHIT